MGAAAGGFPYEAGPLESGMEKEDLEMGRMWEFHSCDVLSFLQHGPALPPGGEVPPLHSTQPLHRCVEDQSVFRGHSCASY